MADYALTASPNCVQRTSDGAFIPSDPDNRDWVAYRLWLADGNTPDAYMVPKLPTVLSFLEFMALFTPAEQVAIVNSSDTQVKLFVLMASGAVSITMSDPRVINGVEYLATVGLIAADRATAILANQPPA